MSLFVYGCYDLNLFKISEEDENNSFYFGYFFFTGIILYIIGIFNWYEGKELVFLIDFILSFHFIILFLKHQNLGNITDCLGKYNNDNLQGVFYILLFLIILIIGVSSKEKGLIYIINYAILFVSFVFLFVFKFSQNELFQKIYGYLFIVTGAFYWLTGLFKFINNLIDNFIIIFAPSD